VAGAQQWRTRHDELWPITCAVTWMRTILTFEYKKARENRCLTVLEFMKISFRVSELLNINRIHYDLVNCRERENPTFSVGWRLAFVEWFEKVRDIEAPRTLYTRCMDVISKRISVDKTLVFPRGNKTSRLRFHVIIASLTVGASYSRA